MLEPKTHPVRPTLSSKEASPEAKALVEALRDVLANEEAWFIAQAHLDRAFNEGWTTRHLQGWTQEERAHILENSETKK